MTASASAATSACAVAASTSNHVYVRSKDHAWVPARLLESNDGTATVSITVYKDEQSILTGAAAAAGTPPTGTNRSSPKNARATTRLETVRFRDYPPSGTLPLQNVDEDGRLRTVADMVDLPFLHEVRAS
jgi:hypothetical protein